MQLVIIKYQKPLLTRLVILIRSLYNDICRNAQYHIKKFLELTHVHVITQNSNKFEKESNLTEIGYVLLVQTDLLT